MYTLLKMTVYTLLYMSLKDDRGELKRKHIGKRPADHRVQSRSAYWYNKMDKVRGLRKIADRASHHRRRKINREELDKYGEDAIPLASTTCAQKRKTTQQAEFPQYLSNRKGSSQSNMFNHSFSRRTIINI